jgi:hypothetical protein
MKNTDAQVREMLKNPTLWLEQLRSAANDRGGRFSSVSDIWSVLNWLHIFFARQRVG